VLREAGVALIGTLVLVTGLVDCWARPPSDGTPPPTPPISAEERELARTIARDALLTDADLPPGLMPRGIGIEEAHSPTLQAYLDDGWILFATNAWVNGTRDVYLVGHTVYVFDDPVRPPAFVDHLAAQMAEIPGATKVSGLPDSAVGYERSFTRQGENERRTVEMAAVVGRLVINLDYEMAMAREDWQDASQALLATAVARASEALTAAGE
jgi:hypothetical protein